jgi:hypothetical protein
VTFKEEEEPYLVPITCNKAKHHPIENTTPLIPWAKNGTARKTNTSIGRQVSINNHALHTTAITTANGVRVNTRIASTTNINITSTSTNTPTTHTRRRTTIVAETATTTTATTTTIHFSTTARTTVHRTLNHNLS